MKRAEERAVLGGSPIERVVVPERPPLTLVARTGDPRGAIAFVAAHGRGSVLSLGLVALLRMRLEAQGLSGIEARAHGLGIEVSRAVADVAEVPRFVGALRSALAEPVRSGDANLARVQREVDAMRSLSFAGPGEAAILACSGELGFDRNAAIPQFTTPAGSADLEATRAAVFRVGAAAFAALGTTAVLEAATRALAADAAWPGGSADDDAWPAADAVFVDSGASPRRLSLALRSPNAEAALAGGLELGASGSALSERLAALNPPWRLERTSAVARVRGACLRLDLAPPKGDAGPSAEEIARAAAIAELSALAALEKAEPGALDESVLRPSNPLKAASLAAWRALLGPSDDAPLRTLVAYLGEAHDGVASAELNATLTALRGRRGRSSFEVGSKSEAGQGELWMLLASPCGTLGEASSDAGALALALRAMALRAGTDAVGVEPWVSADGAGLLAHAPRKTPSEGARDQAERVAAALGRALGTRLGGGEIGNARAQLLTELGGRPFSGWSALLEGLAPGHLSWLEPRGTWAAISELSFDELERTRRYFLTGPLRLSVLANRGEAQTQVAAATLEAWLMPTRGHVSECPRARAEPARHGETRVVQSSGAPEGAYVGAVFAESGAAGARAAELSELVLNQGRSSLQRALAARAPAASATARALGGTRRPALVVEIRALPEQLNDAIAAVRAALDELGRGQLSADEFTQAAARLAERETAARFDPRRRIVELFRGVRPLETDAASLRAAQSTLTSSSHWVVTSGRTP